MSWQIFYLVCFVAGLLLSAVSLLGVFHVHVHVPHVHAHLRLPAFHATAAHAPGAHVSTSAHAASSSSVPALNGFTATAFLCWFGGTGYLLERIGFGAVPLVLIASVASGLFAAGLVFWFLARVLLPLEHPLTADESEMRGVVGKVSGTVRPDGTGEILFSQGGAKRCAPARSEAGERIDKGAEVVVLRYEGGIAYVRRWDEVAGELAAGEDGDAQERVL